MAPGAKRGCVTARTCSYVEHTTEVFRHEVEHVTMDILVSELLVSISELSRVRTVSSRTLTHAANDSHA